MAAGKNTVSDKFVRRGYLSLDADELSHRAIETVSETIIALFSAEADRRGIKIASAGVIDRRALGRLLFSSPALLERQEAIILPEVERETLEAIDTAVCGTEHKYKGVVLNAVSLFKVPRLMSLCTLVVFVTAPAIVRLVRVKRRDGIGVREIIGRFRAQRALYKAYRASGVPIIVLHNWGCTKHCK